MCIRVTCQDRGVRGAVVVGAQSPSMDIAEIVPPIAGGAAGDGAHDDVNDLQERCASSIEALGASITIALQCLRRRGRLTAQLVAAAQVNRHRRLVAIGGVADLADAIDLVGEA